jgi:hypothetical protein
MSGERGSRQFYFGGEEREMAPWNISTRHKVIVGSLKRIDRMSKNPRSYVWKSNTTNAQNCNFIPKIATVKIQHCSHVRHVIALFREEIKELSFGIPQCVPIFLQAATFFS